MQLLHAERGFTTAIHEYNSPLSQTQPPILSKSGNELSAKGQWEGTLHYITLELFRVA